MKIKPLPISAETIALARRLIWFEPAELALAEPIRFLAYAFAAAKAGDMAIVRRHVDSDALRYALQHAPPGIIDARSWEYWHLMLDLGPAPALPQREMHVDC